MASTPAPQLLAVPLAKTPACTKGTPGELRVHYNSQPSIEPASFTEPPSKLSMVAAPMMRSGWRLSAPCNLQLGLGGDVNME
ncbi:hypothetical protein HJFPF1_08039 [Paramyrothecium foliicola]|nr:hypothetical protein HJFPF1_08039 [Paramyrothecium foliicola]